MAYRLNPLVIENVKKKYGVRADQNVARILGVSVPGLHKAKNNDTNPRYSWDRLVSMSVISGVPMQELFTPDEKSQDFLANLKTGADQRAKEITDSLKTESEKRAERMRKLHERYKIN